MELKYRTAEYFNKEDHYLVDNPIRPFVTKLEYVEGKGWYTIDNLKYGCTSVPMCKISRVFNT